MNNNFWSKFPYMGFSTFFVGIIVQAHGFINLIKIIIFWIEAWLSVVVKYDHFIDRLTREAFGDMTQDYSEDAIFAQLFVYFCVIIFGSILVTIGAGMCKTAGGFNTTQNNTTNQAVSNFIQNKQIDEWDCQTCGAKNKKSSVYCYNCGTKKVTTNAKTTPENGEWVCEKCGRTNQSYVGTCGCGEIKPK